MLDLENPANWLLKDSQFFIAIPNDHLPEYTPAFDFNSNIVAVLVYNSEALATWHSAGWISQEINLPFGSSAASNASNKRLRLGNKQLLIFSKLVSTYKISVRFPPWFTQASITIWEYTGAQDEGIGNQLTEIQNKLDTLLQQH